MAKPKIVKIKEVWELLTIGLKGAMKKMEEREGKARKEGKREGGESHTSTLSWCSHTHLLTLFNWDVREFRRVR